MDQRGGIGQEGLRPWQNASYVSQEDAEWFDSITRNQIVVMGSRSWKSWNHKKYPLDQRKVVVFSHNPRFGAQHDVILCSGDMQREFQRLKESYPLKKIFVTGGADVLQQAHDFCDEILVARRRGSWRVDTRIEISEFFEGFRIHSVKPGADGTFETWLRSPKSHPRRKHEG
jgi:dihydrofolate reductase